MAVQGTKKIWCSASSALIISERLLAAIRFEKKTHYDVNVVLFFLMSNN